MSYQPVRRARAPLLLPWLLLAGTAGGASPAPAPMMQAVVAAHGRLGLRSWPRPVPDRGQVLVRMKYAGVESDDWKQASDSAGSGAAYIPGCEGAGIVERVAPGATSLRVGDAVIVWTGGRGAYAQYLAVPAAAAIRKPPNVPFSAAAILPRAGLIAWQMLVEHARVHAGQRVLVLGPDSALGSMAAQIARMRGAQVITDSARRRFEERLHDVDVVVDAQDLDAAERGLTVLRRGGHLLSVAGLPTAAQCAARGVDCSAARAPAAPGPALARLAAWAGAGRLETGVGREFALPQALQAWQAGASGHAAGTDVLRIGR